MPLNLHLLRMFATVVRSGSFSRAAEALHVSQPAISKGVRDFELQLGCRLLDRAPKGVRPTREGQALMRHAEALFATERAAEEEMRSLRSLEQGSLRIGASTTIASYMIADYLGAFHRAHRNVDLHIVSANTREIADLMLGHEIDIALVEGPVSDDELVAAPWRTDVMELIVGPQHRFVTATAPIDAAALADETLIVREPGSGSRAIVLRALQRHGIEPRRTLQIGSTEAIKQAVTAGLGIAIVSAAATHDQIAQQHLKSIAIRGLSIDRQLWQLRIAGRLDAPAAVAFDQLLNAPQPLGAAAAGYSVFERSGSRLA
ncbi:MAG TPA: LysR family transcriptional regulator [Rhodopseudomonas sp.]|uniref:LysR family transcriptional regulator n=1 Tax=Rhodopseudomonas sp. TaxID=1078 RepID=UPI002ED8845F